MATIRKHVRIERPADEVWAVISDAGSISEWFPAIEASSADGDTRQVTLAGGMEVVEDIVTNDGELRRFQYRITGGVPVEFHLGTIDVLEDGDGALVVYGTDVEPGEIAGLLGPALEDALGNLKIRLEA